MSTSGRSNVPRLLLRRELGGGNPAVCSQEGDASTLKRTLEAWREDDFLQHCAADYATFHPAPRSTIALCYSCDGSLLASTHGDHTVKITSCHTGSLVRVLSGHRRTPWVVRFHPRRPSLLASGSLDHEVRLWDAETGQCLARHTFGKPIASLAFHASAPVLAIACGHKLHMWEYGVSGASPTIVLRTQRSMRAVHFHPHGLPLVLTAEVQDPSPTPDLQETLTEEGAFGGRNSRNSGGEGGSSSGINNNTAKDSKVHRANAQQQQQQQQQQPVGPSSEAIDAMSVDAAVPSSTAAPSQAGRTTTIGADATFNNRAPSTTTAEWPWTGSMPPAMVPVGWEVPFPASIPPGFPENAGGFATQLAATYNASVWNILGEEQPPRVRLRLFNFDPSKPATALDEDNGVRMRVSDAVLCSEMGVHFSPCGRFVAATLACRAPMPGTAVDVAAAAVAAAGAAAVAGAASVGGNSNGAAIGADGEAMDWTPDDGAGSNSIGARGAAAAAAAAAAIVASSSSPNGGTSTGTGSDATSSAPSLRSERVVFEVRVVCVDGPEFGNTVKATRIRAAHCLTSVQFSPAGNHVLLAYGKKHSSLLRSLVAEGRALVPLHTILEVVRLSDMSLVGVLPSAEDEINAACFHPIPGGGMAYGTKEGRLRMVTHDRGETRDGGVDGAAQGGARLPSLRELQNLQDLVLMQQNWLEDRERERDGAIQMLQQHQQQ